MNMRNVFFVLVTLLAFYSCSNDNDMGITSVVNQESPVPEKRVEFIRLIDNQSLDAGLLEFETSTSVSEVDVKWIVSDGFNLDTTQSVLSLKNGKGELPIRWSDKLEDGNYGPSDMAFKAGVILSTEDESHYFPLVWAYEVDTLKLSSTIRTRAVGAIPRASSLRFVPQEVEMNSEIGAVMVLVGTDISFAVLNYSSFTSNMNINLSDLPTFVEKVSGLNGFNSQLKFKWTAAGAPSLGFEAYVLVESDNGLTARGTVKYGQAPTLEVTPVALSIPAVGGKNVAVSKISTNQPNWKAVSNQTWLQLAPSMGSMGSYALYSSVEPNPYFVERYATITVTAGDLRQSITVTQKAKSSTIVTTTNDVKEDWGDEEDKTFVIE